MLLVTQGWSETRLYSGVLNRGMALGGRTAVVGVVAHNSCCLPI
jgi:hypothetical protein